MTKNGETRKKSIWSIALLIKIDYFCNRKNLSHEEIDTFTNDRLPLLRSTGAVALYNQRQRTGETLLHRGHIPSGTRFVRRLHTRSPHRTGAVRTGVWRTRNQRLAESWQHGAGATSHATARRNETQSDTDSRRDETGEGLRPEEIRFYRRLLDARVRGHDTHGIGHWIWNSQ